MCPSSPRIRSASRLRKRQREPEDCSLARRAFHADAPSLCLHQALRDRQSKTRVAAQWCFAIAPCECAVRVPKALEVVGEIVLGIPSPVSATAISSVSLTEEAVTVTEPSGGLWRSRLTARLRNT